MIMIERMARAICAADGCDLTENELARCTDLARAVLSVMREPSAGMCRVLGVFPEPPVKHDDPDKAIKLAPMLGIYHIWNGLIDAALKEAE